MNIPFRKSKDQFQVLIRTLKEIQRSIDIFTQDMQDDRHDIAELKIRMGKVEDQLQELLYRWNSQTKKIKEAVQIEIEEVKESIEDLTKNEKSNTLEEKGGEP